MKNSTRYNSAMLSTRSCGERLIEVYSPKLGRRLQCFGQPAFEQWLRLETDPSVHGFCERPAMLNFDGKSRPADFWVVQNDMEKFLVLDEEVVPEKATVNGVDAVVYAISPAELASARQWVRNWEHMIVCLVSYQPFIRDSLTQSVMKCAHKAKQLSQIERELVVGDPSPVRATLYHLLHQGKLKAPQLAIEPLSLLTQFEPG